MQFKATKRSLQACISSSKHIILNSQLAEYLILKKKKKTSQIFVKLTLFILFYFEHQANSSLLPNKIACLSLVYFFVK